MRELTPEEVLTQLQTGAGGTEEEQAAAKAVLAAALAESQNLGRMVVSQGASSWLNPQLRADLAGTNQKSLRRPIN